MPGIQDFTIANLAKETVHGTPVAPTRRLYAEGTGVLSPDFGLNFHETENTGRRIPIRRATSQFEDVTMKLKSASGVAFDELPILFSWIKGGITGTGAGADKTWTIVPSLTGSNAPESYTFDVGDDVQNWRVQYAMASRIKLAAALGDITSYDLELFGQRAIKTAAAAPTGNTAVKIPGDLWTVKFASTFAGLGAAAVQTNFLLAWELDFSTGNVWRHYMDGNLYGGQHVETSFAATLTMTAESTALAISEWYDKAAAGTMDFVRLRATGGALGGSAYQATMDMPVLYDVPEPISDQSDGINLYKVVAHLADDGTNGFTPTVVCSIAALP